MSQSRHGAARAHSIASSARAVSEAGIATPRLSAVLRLIAIASDGAASAARRSRRLMCFPPRPRNSTSGSRNVACLSPRESFCAPHPRRMLIVAVGTSATNDAGQRKSGSGLLTDMVRPADHFALCPISDTVARNGFRVGTGDIGLCNGHVSQPEARSAELCKLTSRKSCIMLLHGAVVQTT